MLLTATAQFMGTRLLDRAERLAQPFGHVFDALWNLLWCRRRCTPPLWLKCSFRPLNQRGPTRCPWWKKPLVPQQLHRGGIVPTAGGCEP